MRPKTLRIPQVLAWTGAAVGLAGAIGGAAALAAAAAGCSPSDGTYTYCAEPVDDAGDYAIVNMTEAGGCPDGSVLERQGA
jgi:hypothetical protein